MNKTAFISIFLFFVLKIDAQNGDSQVASLRNVCSFRVPSNMEVRKDGSLADDASKEFYTSKKVTYNSNSVILQPSGFDDLKKDATGLFGRIIISLEQGKKGEYIKISEMSKEDISLIKNMIIKSFKNNAKTNGMSVLSYSSVEIKNIGGRLAFYYTYIRRSAREKLASVFVQNYRVLDDDKAIQITLSYRSSEKDIWDYKFNEFIKSLKFN